MAMSLNKNKGSYPAGNTWLNTKIGYVNTGKKLN